ncbi:MULTISPECIES: YheC/YheD family protein [Bacillaceae]|uniref:YheC/YheD family protein n=1 Tax=Evansella alkalicola TaxID=745819 RepID=A0ABS6JQC2_9BACI|nr:MULTISPECIES: YheC/YheD family protein [Bacillaceae]MBU9720740.1 YheC/YheD family protein [Bacillus alkalicola]
MLSFKLYISHLEVNEQLHPNQIVLPRKISSIWNIEHKMLGKIGYQFLTKDVEVFIDDTLPDTTIQLAPPIAEHLSLLSVKRLQCFYDYQEKMFHLGPSIGVVIGDIQQTDSLPQFGTITPYIEEMGKSATDLYCPFFVFSYKDVKGTFVEGYTFHDNTWKKGNFPLPHVVYNRIGRRDQERSPQGQDFFQRLKDMNIPYFNDRFLHKWDTHALFMKEPTIEPYLPETKHLQGKNDLYELLSRYSNIFIKPFWGKEGSGIIKVQQEKGVYKITYPTDQGWQTKKVKTDYQLFEILQDRVRKRRYIVQPQIDTLEYSNAPIDFRVLCVKNISGEWKACSTVSRVGDGGKIVSNLAQGGSQRKASTLLKEFMTEEKAKHTIRFMNELGIHGAQIIDRETDGLYGELGFDFMIDKTGHVWILEVNIKPSKGDSLQHSNNSFPSIRLLLDYAEYLTGFSHH